MAGPDIERPAVEWAKDLVAFQSARAEWTSTMGTGVVDRVDGTFDIAEGVAFASNLDGAALARTEAVQVRHIGEPVQ